MAINKAMEIFNCKNIREPGQFFGWSDFYEFTTILASSNFFTQLTVEIQNLNVGLTESWHQCRKCQRIWLLVEPDPPFGGFWKCIT